MPSTWGAAGQHYIFRRGPHPHPAGKGGEECFVDRGLPAELQIWVEMGGWEEVEVHQVAKLRGAHKVHLGNIRTGKNILNSNTRCTWGEPVERGCLVVSQSGWQVQSMCWMQPKSHLISDYVSMTPR